MIRATPVNGFVGAAGALADHDYNTAVATVTRPVLFIAGSKDGVTPAAMQDMHARLPGSRYVELEGRRPYFQFGPADGIHCGRAGVSGGRGIEAAAGAKYQA